MSYDQKQIDRFATSSVAAFRAIEHAHKAAQDEFYQNVRDLLSLYYGRHIGLLHQDINRSFERDNTKTVLYKLSHTKNLVERILNESSLAYAERPVMRARDRRANKTVAAPEPAAAQEPRIPMPEVPPADGAPPTPPAPAAGKGGGNPAADAKTTMPGGGAAPMPVMQRKNETEDDLTALWNEVIDPQHKFWQVIQAAEPVARGVGGVFIMAAYREVAGVKQMTWSTFTPDCVTAVQQLEAPDQPAMIALDQYIDDTDAALMADAQLVRRAFRVAWTPDLVFTYDQVHKEAVQVEWFPEETNGVNPYKFIPGVMLRMSKPENGSLYGPIAENLLTANRQYNLLSTELRMWERYQGGGIIWTTELAKDQKDDVDISPLTVWELKGDGNGGRAAAGVINSNLKIAETEQRRQNIVRDAADDFGLAPQDVLSERGGTTNPSGRAMVQMSSRLVERTERGRQCSEEDVKRLMAMSYLVWKRWNADHPKAKIVPDALEDVEIELRFQPTQRASDDKNAADLRRQKIKDGLETWEDWYMEEHPECSSAEEARAIIMRNKKLNEELNPATASIQDTIAGLTGRQPGVPGNGPPKGVTPPGLAASAAAAAANAQPVAPPEPPPKA